VLRRKALMGRFSHFFGDSTPNNAPFSYDRVLAQA
jgi:hypothetical protein